MQLDLNIIVTVIIFMVVHLCGTVWWMSSVTTTLGILRKTIDALEKTIIKHESTYYSKEDAAKDFAYRDKTIKAAWDRIDKIEEHRDRNKI